MKTPKIITNGEVMKKNTNCPYGNGQSNWLVLMPRKYSRSKQIIIPVIVVLIIGQYTELYYIIWPATVGAAKFGLLEIGTFLGYAGIFTFVVSTYLAKASLVPKNHPYLEESISHHF